MFLTERKLERRVQELKKFRYRELRHIGTFLAKEDTEKKTNPEVPTDFEGWKTMKTGTLEKEGGDRWKGRDLYLWLHTEFTIPEEFSGKRIVGIFDFGKTGAGNNSGFEAMLYIDGKPYQGVDINHQEVFFPEEMVGKTVNATFRLWSGLEGGGIPKPQEHQLRRADLAYLDEATDDLYYMGSLIHETVLNLEEGNPFRYDLLSAMNHAFNLIDWHCAGDEDFYQSVALADKTLNDAVDRMNKTSEVHVSCVGHTHIDMAWLWRLKHTREKASRSFSTVLRMMEQYPEYIFLQTQPQIYEYIKQDFPEIFEKIKERVAEGRWEADGAMWVEADCNLTSGESLTRQILLGCKFIKDEFGKDCEYLWLPDVFGYSWALPQILKKSGIDMFMTTKISWNQYNRMPHDTFKWIGIDGSEVLTHFITTPEPWSEPGSWFYTYNGLLTAKTVKGIWDAYSEKAINKDLLISYGYGDGGGGVNRDLLENRRRIDKIPGLPTLKTGRAGDYFRKLKETIANTEEYVPSWDGELYLEYHRGTYTSHAYNKKMNRKMELLYREAEWLTAMNAIQSGDLAIAKQDELTEGWKIILTNQFHDIIPGSSIHDVYEDCVVDYNKTEKIALEVEEDAKKGFIQASENTYSVMNNSGWTRNEIVAIPVTETGSFIASDGTKLKAQKEDTVTYVEVKDVPAMGFETIHFEAEAAEKEAAVFTMSANHIETPFYVIDLNEYGQMTRLYDKENEREVIREGERANVLQIFEDKPLDNEAWDIDIFYQQKMREVTELTKIEVTECGNLRAVLHMEWKFDASVIKQDMIFYANDRRIDFETWVDYYEVKQLLKVAFPVDIRATYATYDVQYGNVKRPNHWNTSWDQARFETVAHKWVDLSEHNYGVSLLNNCKYGHDIKGNVIRLTLIKTATNPDYLQDLGVHEFTYSLLPHNGDFVVGDTVKEAYALNQPLTVMDGKATLQGSFIELDNPYVELDAVKRSEDKEYLVVRFHEYTGSKRKVGVKLNFEYKGWMESDLRERPIEEMHTEKEIQLEVKPFEIKTILLKLA